MSEPAQKCENYEAIFKQNYTPELIIALKMVYSCFFGLRGNLDFPNFIQRKFYNINSCLALPRRYCLIIASVKPLTKETHLEEIGFSFVLQSILKLFNKLVHYKNGFIPLRLGRFVHLARAVTKVSPYRLRTKIVHIKCTSFEKTRYTDGCIKGIAFGVHKDQD